MSRLIEIASGRFAHASGALWLRAERIAFVADAHLGYGWAQRRRGQLGPVFDGAVREKLELLIDELQPLSLIFLGDVVHAPKPAVPERAIVEDTLGALARRTHLTFIRGNHDRAFDRDYPELGIQVVDRWESAGLIALHGDRLQSVQRDGPPVVLGHLHPALGVIDDAGASQRIPIFLVSGSAYVLPAFSPFAAGFNVRAGLPRELRQVFGKTGIDVIAATGRRAVHLGPLDRHTAPRA